MHRTGVIIISRSSSCLDHRFAHHIGTAPSIEMITISASVRRTGQVLSEGRTCKVLCFPARFDGGLRANGRAAIPLCYSVDDLLFCGTFLLTTARMSLSLKGRVQVRGTPNTSTGRRRVAIGPVPCRSIALFGARGNFTDFLIPTVLVLIVRRALILKVNVLKKATHRGGHFRDLIPVDQRFGKALHVILNGSLACVLVCMIIYV